MITYKFYNKIPQEARFIRESVFIKEQGFENEFDYIDNTAVHIVIFCDNAPAATGRMFASDKNGFYTIGRIAVLPKYRKLHLGRMLIEKLEEKACELGAIGTELSAQCRVQHFYEKCGYITKGEIYLDEFCEHIHMTKNLLSAN